MSAIRSKNTKPEAVVRSLLFALGYRYRLHRKDLPGKPDIVLKKHNTIIFVHGCFWHHHKNCRRANWPKSNQEYWLPKIQRNIERDKIHIRKLKKEGWEVLVIWECQIKNMDKLSLKIQKHFRRNQI
jgi:DNA mismatch endonuclease (patch repair protein)|tara:strand:- start:25 stop:405 length:381 start_codon:yes stop_codon:yes gene_type:complete